MICVFQAKQSQHGLPEAKIKLCRDMAFDKDVALTFALFIGL